MMMMFFFVGSIHSLPLLLLLVTVILLSFKCAAFELVCPRKKGSIDTDTRLIAQDDNGQDFYEISGLALSPTLQTSSNREPLLYGVNDRGGGKRLGVFDSGTGKRLKTLRLDALPSSEDWESLAIGSCGIHWIGETCIYIADTGDNSARNSGGDESRRGGVPYRIFKVRELAVVQFQDNQDVTEDYLEVLEFDYNHVSSPTEFADVEAIFLDHKGWRGQVGDVYILTKWNGRDIRKKNRLFRIPASAWSSSSTYSPIAVGNYNQGGDLLKEQWTRADMTLDGTLIALGDGSDTYLFPRCPGTSVADALTGGADSCYDWENPRSRDARQFETFAWTPDASRNLQISECTKCNPPMGWTTMDYTNPAKTITCKDYFEGNSDTPNTPAPTNERPTTIGRPGTIGKPKKRLFNYARSGLRQHKDNNNNL